MSDRTQIVPGYNSSMSHFVETAENRWGNPEENILSMVRYGITHLDRALYGIDVRNGELIIIQAPEKARKTTTILNIICNVMTADLPVIKPPILFDTLESGSPPDKIADALIVMMASRYLINKGHRQEKWCTECDQENCKELVMGVDWLRFHMRSRNQKEALDYARDITDSWSLDIFGAPESMGNARDLYRSMGLGKEGRWYKAMQEYGTQIFISDHLQQYRFQDGTQSDYEKQIRSVDAMGDFVASNGAVVFALSQISLTSIREANSGSGKWRATGGAKASQEAVTILSTYYDSEENPEEVRIRIEDSRKASSLTFFHKLDPFSGSLIEDSYVRSAKWEAPQKK